MAYAPKTPGILLQFLHLKMPERGQACDHTPIHDDDAGPLPPLHRQIKPWWAKREPQGNSPTLVMQGTASGSSSSMASGFSARRRSLRKERGVASVELE